MFDFLSFASPFDDSFQTPSLGEWLGGVSGDEGADADEERQALVERMQEAVAQLPEIDQELLEFVARGIRQKDIGALYGLSQAAICCRVQRASQRLRWLVARPPRPATFLEDLRAALARSDKRTQSIVARDKFGVLAVEAVVEGTSQLRAAERFGLGQGRVRHWCFVALERLLQLGLVESHAYARHSIVDGKLMLHPLRGLTKVKSLVNSPPRKG